MAYNVYNSMDIGDASVGISRKGIENYKQAVFADMNGVKRELDDYKNIVDVIGTAWNGAAAQKFVNNLHTSKEKAKDALDKIEQAMEALFETIKNGMIKQDEQMISDDDIAF